MAGTLIDNLQDLELEDTKDLLVKRPDGKIVVFSVHGEDKPWTIRIYRAHTPFMRQKIDEVSQRHSKGQTTDEAYRKEMCLICVAGWMYGPAEYSREALNTILSNPKLNWISNWIMEKAVENENFMRAT